MNFEVVITCAVTGAGDTVGKSNKVPITPKEIANAGDCIVAFGSLYIAAEFVELIKNIKPEYYIYE